MKKSELIIDVGMHTAEDTEFYLAKGYDVVAIEANPALVAEAERRFAAEIEAGRLTIYGVAVAEQAGTARFAVADNTVWSSLSNAFIERNVERWNTQYDYVEVPTMPFGHILSEVGVPHYLKIDIEGLDLLCVTALREFDDRPDYLSIESTVSTNRPRADDVFGELSDLWSLGYRRFKYINQNCHDTWTSTVRSPDGARTERTFELGSSGPFGEESDGSWRSVSATYGVGLGLATHHNFSGFGGAWTDSLPAKVYRRSRRILSARDIGWYDLHAAL